MCPSTQLKYPHIAQPHLGWYIQDDGHDNGNTYIAYESNEIRPVMICTILSLENLVL